jgi:hypothetical protein
VRVVRTGVTRTVILVGRWAVKVPSLRAYGDGLKGVLWSFCRGVLANQSETEWCGYDRYVDNVAPVRRSWLGGVVNVYPRCSPLLDNIEEKDYPDVGPHPTDAKRENVGWLGERLVWLDYDMSYNGCPHDRSGRHSRE